jgi:hypothetical protein
MLTLLATVALLQDEGANYQHLKRIEWMIGSWGGQGKMPGVGDYEDEFVYEWTMKKNFIKGTYVIRAGGKIVWTDTGLIGWDADKKKIFGANFGMDGTIGWGHEEECGDAFYIVAGRTAGPVVREDFRFRVDRIDADHLRLTVEMKQDGKDTKHVQEYTRKKVELPAVPESADARYHEKHLKRLEGLIGRWSGKGESPQGVFSIDYSFEWALNRNFIVKTVTATAMGQVAWSAVEWIGWDVDKKTVVAITFGFDGSLSVAHATDAADALVLEGTARTTLKVAGGKLDVLIERKDGDRWVTEKKIAAEPRK